MKYTKRLSTIFSEFEQCDKFADIGCDHGYCAEYMLEKNLCEHAVVSDISAESLKKAQLLLSGYAACGKVTSVCCNGMENIPKDCDFVLIAGMGGEEIVAILKNGYIPQKLLLQPMKNTRKVREFLLAEGLEITADYTFADGKYYDLIKAAKTGGKSVYTDLELEFGRDNLLHPSADFIMKLQSEIVKKESYLKAPLGKSAEQDVGNSLRKLQEVYHVACKNL